MAAGHIVAGQCVDVAASADLYFSSQPTTSASDASFIYQTFFTKSFGVWKLAQRSYNKVDQSYILEQVIVTTPQFPSCETDQSFKDGVQLGWGVAAAMVVVFVIRRVFR